MLEAGSFDRLHGNFDVGASHGEFSARFNGLVRDSDMQIDVVDDDRIQLAPSIRWQHHTSGNSVNEIANRTMAISPSLHDPCIETDGGPVTNIGMLFVAVLSPELQARHPARRRECAERNASESFASARLSGWLKHSIAHSGTLLRPHNVL